MTSLREVALGTVTVSVPWHLACKTSCMRQSNLVELGHFILCHQKNKQA